METWKNVNGPWRAKGRSSCPLQTEKSSFTQGARVAVLVLVSREIRRGADTQLLHCETGQTGQKYPEW